MRKKHAAALSAFLSAILLSALGSSTPAAAQGYGTSAAVGTDEVFIGEPSNERSPGYVYVYRNSGSGWEEVQRLAAEDGDVQDGFGKTLALASGDLLVGAGTGRNARGAVYVFRKDASGTWQQASKVVPSDMENVTRFGDVIATDGSHVLVSPATTPTTTGEIYVLGRDQTGAWSVASKFASEDVRPGDGFGAAAAVEGDHAIVGAPGTGDGKGAAYAFRRVGGSWIQTARLEMDHGILEGLPGADAYEELANQFSLFGIAVALSNGVAMVGAPAAELMAGTVHVYRLDSESNWHHDGVTRAFDGQSRAQFGSAISGAGSQFWIGAPGMPDGGRLYALDQDEETREWTALTKVAADDLSGDENMGSVVALGEGIAAAGFSRDDFSLGSAAIIEHDGDGWTTAARVMSESATALDPITGEDVACDDGLADDFTCTDVDIVSFLPVGAIGGSRGVEVNDLWGWTDPVTGTEWALVGRYDGTSFIDLADPGNPVYAGNLPLTEGARPNTWRDIKVYNDHAFIVADNAGQHGMQIFDLTQLREPRDGPVTFEETARYDGFHSSHNIVINEDTGFAYAVGSSGGGATCGGGLHMIDIRDPLNPAFAGCFADASTGRSRTGYSHDALCIIYDGPDEEHRGKEICLGSNEDALSIADVTDKDAPVALSVGSYPNAAYSHQGWVDEAHEYFYMNDELDEVGGLASTTRTLIWDISDLDEPIMVKEHFAETNSSDHNLYIRGDLMYQSNYVSGLRILDISDRENPREVAFFDTVPWIDDAPGFDGSWSNYPFFASGVIVVTSGKEGVFVLKNTSRNLIP